MKSVWKKMDIFLMKIIDVFDNLDRLNIDFNDKEKRIFWKLSY